VQVLDELEVSPATETAETPRDEQIAQALLKGVLFAIPTLLCIYAAIVSDPDVWWHLRAGEWMLAHHAVPQTDPFSLGGMGKPWISYSWLYDLLITGVYGRLGLLGIVTYTSAMTLAITVALYHLVKRLQGDFNLAVVLTFVASLSFERLYSPRPWHFTILFFVLLVDIVMHVRETGKARELLWLPVLFAVWANVHIQFIDGLIVLGLAVAEAVVGIWWDAARTRLKPLWIVAAMLASLAATLANPYGWKIYKTAYELATQPGVMDKITELQSIPFRFMSDDCVLLLALAAAAALAWRRQIKVFETVFLLMAAYLSFRSRRDIWVVVTVAVAIIADSIGSRPVVERRSYLFLAPVTAVATSLIVGIGFFCIHLNNTVLSTRLANDLPVKAVAYVKDHQLSGPLYNDYGWGGYLMWGLRQPVAIDGRAGVQGTERLDQFGNTWAGDPSWKSDPDLQKAGVVIGPVKAPLTQILRMDARFKLAYEDKVAAVFVGPGATH
jgi:hypothetical protein